MTNLNYKRQVLVKQGFIILVLLLLFILHDGVQREYILYVPASYTGSDDVPLVFNFHGYGSNAFEQLNYGDFRELAEQYKFLVVHPQGTLDAVGRTHFNVGWGNSTADDVGFTAALMDNLIANYAVDQKRIYSTGMSNGGFMSYKLGCELSDRIAAISSVTGTMTRGQRNNCNTSHPIPILEIHGTDDATVAYQGNQLFESIAEVLRFWVEKVDSSRQDLIKLEDSDMNDSSKVEYQVYSGGENGVTIEHLKVLNGGHTWPGSKFEIGPVTNKDIDASAEIWKFFSKYDIDGLLESADNQSDDASNENEDTIKVYPNPTDSYLKISNNLTSKGYTLVDKYGSVISSGKLFENDTTVVDLRKFSPGIYFLVIEGTVYRVLKTK